MTNTWFARTLAITLPYLAAGLLSGCSGQMAKDVSSTVTQKTVEAAKGTATGIEEGIAEGRKSAASADGAIIVTNGKELAESLTVEVIAVSRGDIKDTVIVEIGLGNKSDKPVRVSGLAPRGAVILLDKDGFASYLAEPIYDIVTVPENAKEKVAYTFSSGDYQKAHKIRIHGQETEIPADKIQQQ